MWKAGTCKNSEQSSVNSEQFKNNGSQLFTIHYSLFTCKGFTLIELLVVLTILSISLGFVIPRLIGREEAELKSSSRKLLYTIRRLSDEALFKKEKKVLSINIEKGEYQEEEKGKKSYLPEGVAIAGLTIGKKEVLKGTASITFYPSGFRDEAEIRLTGRGKGIGKGYKIIIPALGERFEIIETSSNVNRKP